jgi:hypothetical protein
MSFSFGSYGPDGLTATIEKEEGSGIVCVSLKF